MQLGYRRLINRAGRALYPDSNRWPAWLCKRHATVYADRKRALVTGAAPKLVLGIETSCDDTGAAVVTSDGRVLGEALATQADIHAPWGGVVPSLAMEAHREAIEQVVGQALAQAGISASQLDAVAVTIGPGLSLCLRVGVAKARQLAREHQLPMINVHHMEGHALVARLPPSAAATSRPVVDCTAGQAGSTPAGPAADGGQASASASTLDSQSSNCWQQLQQEVTGAAASGTGCTSAMSAGSQVEGAAPEELLPGPETVAFPFLCLLVSGGHNLLLLVKGVGQYVQLGTTLDDALGEAYDKIARLLGLELKPNGGAALEAFARQGNPQAFKFVVPMKKYPNCDFSYAGLKTSVRLAIEKTTKEFEQQQDQQDQQQQGHGGTEEATSSAAAAAEVRGQTLLQAKADIAASFQYVACLHLTQRVKRGIKWAKELLPELKDLVVAGGVASNQYIRAELAQVAAADGLNLVMPPPRWCTDNGVMIAWAGVERLKLGLVEPPPAPLPDFSSSEASANATSMAGSSSSTAEVAEPHGLLESQPQAGSLGNGRLQDAAASGSDHAGAHAGKGQEQVVPRADVGWDPSQGASPEEEWVELRPRWPLTSERHAKCMPENLRSARKARVFTSLTDLTAAAAAGGSPVGTEMAAAVAQDSSA